MSKYKDFTILVPCYNEEETIGSVLVQMLSLNPKHIVVVDDGSTDRSAEIIKYLQGFGKIILVQHTKNVGVGSALKSGFRYCLNLKTKYVVTVDADNQHSKKDTKKVMDEILKKDLLTVAGVRKFHKNIPMKKKFSNFMAKTAFVLLYGINTPDPLCGLRAYSKDLLPELLTLENGYDWAVSVNKLMRSYKKESAYVSIDAIYTPYSLSSKSLTYFKGFLMLYKMVMIEMARKVDLFLNNGYSDLEIARDANVILPRRRVKPMYMLDERLFIVSKFD
jgi:glycosyltransferase involved in cell wall biosynthesis